jgi:hypothetical protein
MRINRGIAAKVYEDDREYSDEPRRFSPGPRPLMKTVPTKPTVMKAKPRGTSSTDRSKKQKKPTEAIRKGST